MKLHELDDHRLVDAIRVLIGLQPLYLRKPPDPPCGTYLSLESLCQSASPDCTTCGGSGYYDGWHLDMRCGCTGIPSRDHSAQRSPMDPNRAFVRPKGRRWSPRYQP